MPFVLVVGEDELLQRTRAAVLQRTGAETACSDSTMALSTQAEVKAHVVVLCHSLHPAVCHTLAEEIHHLWPETRVLLVISDREWGYTDARAAADEVISCDPGALLQRTAMLLAGVGAESHAMAGSAAVS